MASETTPLTSGDESRTYLFLSQRHRSRRTKIRQFQCCVCAAMLGIFVTAMVVTVSYSMNHDDEDNGNNTEKDTNDIEVLLPAPNGENPLKTLLTLTWPRPDAAIPDWNGPMPTDLEVAAALEEGEERLKDKDLQEARAKIQNDTTGTPGILHLGTPSYMHQQAIKTTQEAIKAARVGYVIGVATEKLARKNLMASGSVGKGPEVHAYWIPTGMTCQTHDMKSKIDLSSECPPSPYRTMDGKCNNLVHPEWGVAMRPFRRVLPPDYADGISVPRQAKDGSYLPSARDVSLTIHRPIYRNDPKFTVMLAVWGQFFDHDITATALSKNKDGAPIACCTEDGKLAKGKLNPECYPVVLSPEDPYYSEFGMTCMEFVRSAPSPTCNFGPREQLNQITSYIDASVVYGSSEEQAMRLRSPNGKGELHMMITSEGRELLPPSTDPRDGCNTPEMNQKGKYCFMSGDTRANENMHLTTMHLLLAREHNRLVRALSKINPSWDDERLYQEGRRIVAAQLQHITYNEFLPVILGESLMDKLKLAPQKDGYFTGYNPEVSPVVANHFATAAFRFAHTLLPTLMKILGNDTSSEEYVELHKILFNPYLLYSPNKMESALKGALATDIQKVDTYLTPEVTQHLFQQRWSEDYDKAQEKNGTDMSNKGKKKGYGLDLASLNVQRGRDHGLPSYIKWRQHCGMSKPKSFSDLKGQMDDAALQRLATLFKSVEDVDMYSGSLSEVPIGEGLLGPTFSCLIADQFLRLKLGDRYWYETPEQPQAFTPDQLNEIRKTSLASIICDNSGVERAQQWVMRTVDPSNPRVSCTSIPRLQIEAWQDKSMVGHVKLSSPSIRARIMTKPHNLEDIKPSNKAFASTFIKGTVVAASVTATDSDGNRITVLDSSLSFPKSVPAHLFDTKALGTAADGTGGMIPPFYHGGGGVTWTGTLTQIGVTQANFKGNFAVPVFKHGLTPFDFGVNSYVGDFDITVDVIGNLSITGLPVLQGTYSSGIFFQVERPSLMTSPPSNEEIMESAMNDASISGSALPQVPLLLYGSYSLDRAMFNWNGNISLILPISSIPTLTKSNRSPSSGIHQIEAWQDKSMIGHVKLSSSSIRARVMTKPYNLEDIKPSNKAFASTFIKGTVVAASVTATDSDGNRITVLDSSLSFPKSVPAHLFDTKALGTAADGTGGMIPPFYHGGGGVTWTGTLTQIGVTQANFKGSFTVPVFKHGLTPFDFGVNSYVGDFDITVDVIGNLSITGLPVLQGTYSSGIFFQVERPSLMTSPPSNEEIMESAMNDASISGSALPQAPLLLYGSYSLDRAMFNWNGNISLILPIPSNPTLTKSINGKNKMPKIKGSSIAVDVTATWGVVTAVSSPASPTGTAGSKTVVTTWWDGSFPVAIPQPAFDRTDSHNVLPLTAAANTGGGLIWSGTMAPVPGASSGDVYLNGTYTFPVFTHGKKGFLGDPTIFTETFWRGNFSVILQPTIASKSLPLSLSLLAGGGPFKSPVFFRSSALTEKSPTPGDDPEVASSVIPIILHGYTSIDKSIFFWTGNATLLIPNPTTLTKTDSEWENNYGTRKTLKMIKSVKLPVDVTLLSGSLNMTSFSTSNIPQKNVSWNGEFPITIPQPAFYPSTPLTLTGENSKIDVDPPYSPLASSSYKSEITWSNLTAQVVNSSATSIQINGSFSFPVFYFGGAGGKGMWTGPTILNWTGIFNCTLNVTEDDPTAVESVLTLISGGIFTSSVYFKNDIEATNAGGDEILMASPEETDPSSTITDIIILVHGTMSMDKTEFYWNGEATLLIPTSSPDDTDDLLLTAVSGFNSVTYTNRSYLTGTLVSGNVMAQSSKGNIMWWNGELPLPISMHPFDIISPDAAMFTWPYDPTIYNGTGGIIWTGKMTTTSINQLNVKGSFSVPVFIHGNPSVFEVEEWNGDFSLDVKVNFNSTDGGSQFMEGKYNSPVFFREQYPKYTSNIDIINEITNLMASPSSYQLGSSASLPLPRVPLVLWGNYSNDTKTFYWQGNISAIFIPVPNSITTLAKAITSDSGMMRAFDIYPELFKVKRIRLAIKVMSGSITASSASFSSKALWDGTLPFNIKSSIFQKYSEDTSFIGGPITWTGHFALVDSAANHARMEGSFKIPILTQSNISTMSFETWTGDFSFLFSFNTSENIMDILPNNGPFISRVILGISYPTPTTPSETDSDDSLEVKINEIMESIETPGSDSAPYSMTNIPTILQGDFSPDRNTFTWNGEAILYMPEKPSSLMHRNILGKSRVIKPAGGRSDSSKYRKSRQRKINGWVTAGHILGSTQYDGNNDGKLWNGDFPVRIPLPAFDRYSRELEEYDPSFNKSRMIHGGVTWKVSHVTPVGSAVRVRGNFLFPIFNHGRADTFSVTVWKGRFSLDAMLAKDKSIDMLRRNQKYRSRVYFHEDESYWNSYYQNKHTEDDSDGNSDNQNEPTEDDHDWNSRNRNKYTDDDSDWKSNNDNTNMDDNNDWDSYSKNKYTDDDNDWHSNNRNKHSEDERDRGSRNRNKHSDDDVDGKSYNRRQREEHRDLLEAANYLGAREHRSNEKFAIIILKGKHKKTEFFWSGKFVLIFKSN